jgi:hypothetical protein
MCMFLIMMGSRRRVAINVPCLFNYVLLFITPVTPGVTSPSTVVKAGMVAMRLPPVVAVAVPPTTVPLAPERER